jgi:hypothetical protein
VGAASRPAHPAKAMRTPVTANRIIRTSTSPRVTCRNIFHNQSWFRITAQLCPVSCAKSPTLPAIFIAVVAPGMFVQTPSSSASHCHDVTGALAWAVKIDPSNRQPVTVTVNGVVSTPTACDGSLRSTGLLGIKPPSFW